MEAILKHTDTAMLEDAYKTYVGRVLKETAPAAVNASEKEEEVLAEGKVEKVSGVVKSGDNVDQLNEEKRIDAARPVDQKQPTISDAEKLRLQRIGGVI